MAATLWPVASSNAFSTTLSGSIDNAVTTITLTSVTGLSTSGGILVLDRQDGSGNNTPSAREFISFTGVSSLTLTGVTRGVAGSSAQAHNSGSLVEETFSVTHWLDQQTFLKVEHTSTGTHVLSTPTISSPRIVTSFQASGASLVGSFPLNPVWVIPGFASAATTTAGTPLVMPQAGNWESFTLIPRTPVSTASLNIDIFKNGTTIFQTATRPGILGAGTLVSTASILTKVFAKGDIFTVDIITGGNVADLTVIGRGVL